MQSSILILLCLVSIAAACPGLFGMGELQNMQSTSVDSSKAVNGALEAKQLNRFVVVCSETPFVFTVRADTAYCGATKNGHNCHAFAM
ncbi:Protein CBG01310 [Caenorhabditis briggsae]|uniref:Protein CBG01310 n=1 Tax=Caenorhabditis briggsae TaxID=6238 RepID=A8WQ40_CAEBR|nr:Protein CBG01310 [Caenorhabditis briggsae]CAP22598.2 Protein CBG01310 [Caenorhabditis briggsae]